MAPQTMATKLKIGTVSDEVSRNISEAFEAAMSWGIQRFELREGSKARFPKFLPEEIATIESAIRDGAKITAVSPGILKVHADNARQIRHDIDQTLQASLALANRFNCPKIIVFGFEKYEGEPKSNQNSI